VLAAGALTVLTVDAQTNQALLNTSEALSYMRQPDMARVYQAGQPLR
jgi:hypothetical protein